MALLDAVQAEDSALVAELLEALAAGVLEERRPALALEVQRGGPFALARGLELAELELVGADEQARETAPVSRTIGDAEVT